MKKLIAYIIAAIITCNFNFGFAQKQTPPAGGTPKNFTLPEKKVNTLSNGLRTTLVEYGDVPKVNISLIIKTGNIHEDSNQVWLANLTGNMMKEGTKTMDAKTLSKKAAGMGGELDIYVGSDETTISGSVLSEFAPDFIKLVADVAMNPAFPESELERLKTNLKRDLAVQKAVPQSQAEEKFFQIIYKDHPYGRYFPTEEMLSGYSLGMVKNFYNKNFGAKRSVLYVVGKYNEAAVNTAAENAFNKWQAGPDINYFPPQNSNTRDSDIIDRKNASQTTIMLGLRTITPKDADYVPLLITNSLLGGSFGSRITSNIRENKGYTYSPFSTIQNRHGVAVWYEQADVTSEHTIDALREIRKEITRLQNEPPAKEELEGIQNYEAGIFVLRNSSPDGIIGQLDFLDQNNLSDSYLTSLVKNMYAVTPEKVSAVAKDYFKYENMTLVMVGDKDKIEQQRTNSQ